MKTEQTNKINKIENKFLSYKNNDLVKIDLIKNIRICNNKEDYRYTKNNWFQIIFNLIDDSNNIWNFDDENTMENILKKIKKELNTKELNTENTMNKLEALKYLCETTQRSIGGMEFFYLQQDIILENKEIYLKEDIDILIRKVESKIY